MSIMNNIFGILACVILLCRTGSALPTIEKVVPLQNQEVVRMAEGPPIESHNQRIGSDKSEPQPPSIDLTDLELRAPAPPEDQGPQPPAPPDLELLELFESDPNRFDALFNREQGDPTKDKRAIDKQKPPKRWPSFDQFLTAAVISGFDLRNRIYTMFAPEDRYLAKINLSLPLLGLQDKNCLSEIVKAHTVTGKVLLVDGMEDVAVSLQELPIFTSFKEVNGVAVVRANIETDYGIVHIINGLIDQQKLIDGCPSLSHLHSATYEGQASSLHNINLRKVSDLGPLLDQDSSSKGNDINSFDNGPIFDTFEKDPFVYSSSEADVPIELLANIDQFAHAMKLTWQTEDSVIATLQNLGVSTFLALLERSNLMDTLAGLGPWTIFVPDNDAWHALPEGTFDYIMKDPVLLKQILSYHIVPMNATRRHLRNNQMLPSLHHNHPVHVNLYSDGWVSWYTASGSQILNLDEIAANGVVHVVRSVLFPPHGDLYSTVEWTPALQISFPMLQRAQIPELFNDSMAVTAFLPVDSPHLEEVLSSLTLTSSDSSILKRHMAGGSWFTSGLIDGDQIYNLNGEILSISHDADCMGINGACIVVRDITLTNGVLHVIDRPI